MLNKKNLIDIKIINTGLESDSPSDTSIFNYNIGDSTRNFCQTAAMDLAEYEKGIENGAKLIADFYGKGTNCIGFGVTANESIFSSFFLTSALTNTDLEDVISFDDTNVNIDQEVIITKIKQARAIHSPMTLTDTMCAFGGFDIVTIVGAILKAAELKMTVLIDGFVPASALLYAYQINELVLDYCIFANRSKHKGHRIILDYFEKEAILDLNIGSNLGLGVPMVIPIIEGAIACLDVKFNISKS